MFFFIYTYSCYVYVYKLYVFCVYTYIEKGSKAVLVVKNPLVNAGDIIDSGLNPGSEVIPWRRKRQPTPVMLPGKSHGQGNLVGYSPWGLKELDTTVET